MVWNIYCFPPTAWISIPSGARGNGSCTTGHRSSGPLFPFSWPTLTFGWPTSSSMSPCWDFGDFWWPSNAWGVVLPTLFATGLMTHATSIPISCSSNSKSPIWLLSVPWFDCPLGWGEHDRSIAEGSEAIKNYLMLDLKHAGCVLSCLLKSDKSHCHGQTHGHHSLVKSYEIPFVECKSS